MRSRESSQKKRRMNTTMVKVNLLTSMATIVLPMATRPGHVKKVNKSVVVEKDQEGRRSKRAGMSPLSLMVRKGNREIKRERRRISAMK